MGDFSYIVTGNHISFDCYRQESYIKEGQAFPQHRNEVLSPCFLGKETKSKKHCEIFSHNILNRNEKYDI